MVKDIKDISKMAIMERHRYITENSKVCSCCATKRRLSWFWDKEHPTKLSDVCRKCTKLKYKEHVKNIVLKAIARGECT